MKINEVFEYLKELAPLKLAADYDNPGLLIGDGDTEVTKAVVSLDCTPAAIDMAIESGANLIITHHPIIFKALKNIGAESAVYKVIKNGISVISMHTNLDSAVGGVNDCLAAALELKNKKEIIDMSEGYFRFIGGETDISDPDEFARFIKNKLGGAVKYSAGKSKIKKVAVCGGAGGSFMPLISLLGYDALVTADVKHNIFVDCLFEGVCVYDAGHFNTEDVVIDPLCEKLNNKFGEHFATCHTSNIKTV